MYKANAETHVKITDEYSGFCGKLGVITGFNGVVYSVDILTDDDDGNETRQPATFARDQFEPVRAPWPIS